MADALAATKKRKLSASVGKKPPIKRRKGQSSGQLPKTKTKRPVAADDLPWRTVEVPEMFDDAEGFYGLEEVEGVDVVRDGNTVQFVCAFPAQIVAEECSG